MLASVLTGLSILIIGDSHLTVPTYLIDSLHTSLEQRGASVQTFGVCGSTPSDWLKATPGTCGAAERAPGGEIKVLPANTSTKPVSQLISTQKPDLVIVMMGDTLAGYKDSAFPIKWAWLQVTGLAKEIARTKTACVWVGPPWGAEGGTFQKTEARTRQVSSFLASNVAPCDYIDSLSMAKPGEWPSTDGQHLNRTGYQAWGNAITQQLLQTTVIKELEKK